MSVKISVSAELGIKKVFEVKESNKNIRATYKLQKAMAAMSMSEYGASTNVEDFENVIDEILEIQQTVIDYVVNTLGLTDAQAEKLDELELNETMNLAMKISSKLLHIEAEPVSGEAESLKA